MESTYQPLWRGCAGHVANPKFLRMNDGGATLVQRHRALALRSSEIIKVSQECGIIGLLHTGERARFGGQRKEVHEGSPVRGALWSGA